MGKLGVSVYPDYAGIDEIKAYLSSAKALGYECVFTSLLLGAMGFEGASRKPFETLGQLAHFCTERDMRLCADVDETALAALGASPADLSAFRALGVDTLRIDGGFSPAELALMSANPYGLGIEINASAALIGVDASGSAQLLRGLLDEAIIPGSPKNLSACHNFYPLPDTGLDMDAVDAVNAVFREKGIRVGGFVASQTALPLLYPNGHGLPTIEAHRHLPPQYAAAELFVAGFDDVTLGDYPASAAELRLVAGSAEDLLDIPVVQDCYADNGLLEKLFGMPLRSRSDQPERVIRVADSRGIYVKPNRTAPRPAFSVTVCNERAGRYMGEVQITLCDLNPSPEHNVIGFVHPDARRLLAYIKGGAKGFRISEYRTFRKEWQE